jgi:D-alanyl-D-alanine carboxypeptidase
VTLPEGIAEEIRSLLAANDVPGAAVALAVDGRIVSAGVGFRDLERKQPLDGDARFYLYSITKTLVAVAALRLVEEGRVALDQPVQPLLPELTIETALTLRQLLNHTAGLPDYGGMPAYHEDLKTDPGRPWTDAEFLERTLPRGLRFPPGQGWAYSNIGFLLVRRLIERLMGGDLREALADLIVAPLGLRRTMVAETLADAGDLTPGYSTDLDRDGVLRDVAPRYHPGWVSHGVVVSTASETARIVEALFTGRLLRPELLAAMLAAVDVPGDYPPFVRPGYGLGLMIDTGSPYGRVAGHAGGGPGYSTAAFHFPDVAGQRVTAVALANRAQGNLAVEIAFVLARSVQR